MRLIQKTRAAGLFALAWSFVLAFSSPAAADCNDPFGKPEEVLDFHVDITTADWTALKATKITAVDSLPYNSPACMDQFKEFKAKFRCGDQPWIPIGLRKKKGEERGAEAPAKPPLKIDFNEDFMGMVPTAKGQRWPMTMGELGYRKLTLNNGQGNAALPMIMRLPVLLTEHVALRMLNKELPQSPRAAFAKLTVHFDGKADGQYIGVYILIEDIDRTALRRRGWNGVGALTKESKANCAPEIEYDDGPPNPAKAAFDAWLAKSPSGFAGKWLDESAKGLDLDALLTQEAIREILVNGNDTVMNSLNPTQIGNNWYAYDPKDGLRQFIPWDVDLSFGQQNRYCMPTPKKCAATHPILFGCQAGADRTISKIGNSLLCNSEVQKRYLEIMCHMTQGTLSADEILKVWNQADASIRPIIPLEKDYVWNGVDPLLTTNDKSYGSEFERLKAWIPARIKSVQEQITKLGVNCAATCQDGAKETCSSVGCPGERTCQGGRWTPCKATVQCHQNSPPADAGVPMSDAGTGAGGTSGANGGGSGSGSSGGVSGGGNGGSAGNSGSGGNMNAGGSSAGSGGGGSSNRGGSSGSAGGSSGSNSGSDSSSSGGCDVVGGGSSSAGGLAYLLLVMGAVLRRRARRSQRA